MPTERSTLSSAQRCPVQRRTSGSPSMISVIASSDGDDDASALQLQPDQEDIGVVGHPGGIGMQLVVAVLALERKFAGELVGQRAAERHPGVLALQAAVAVTGRADIVVETVPRPNRPDQPAPQRMIDLDADVAPQ